jgi:S1-C subfamily serine protease
MPLPGSGFGVEEVKAGSPAEAVGLTPGMVITKCNGIVIDSEDDMSTAIANSEGLLEIEVLDSADGEMMTATIAMERIAVSAF